MKFVPGRYLLYCPVRDNPVKVVESGARVTGAAKTPAQVGLQPAKELQTEMDRRMDPGWKEIDRDCPWRVVRNGRSSSPSPPSSSPATKEIGKNNQIMRLSDHNVRSGGHQTRFKANAASKDVYREESIELTLDKR